MIMPALLLTPLVITFLIGMMIFNFKRGKQKAKEYNRDMGIKKIENIGETETLKITPLIDWYTEKESLKGEAGSSYLIDTDENKILFDLGLNAENEHPSPLLYNMGKLNIKLEEIDTVIISHNHIDHIGGLKWQRKNSFSLSGKQIDIDDKKIYTPVEMEYPGTFVKCTKESSKICEGVTTTGTIANQLVLGWIEEQAVAINLKNKGIVLVVGCGHQTVPKLVKRCEELFDETPYAIIGGLHFPVSGGRGNFFFSLFQKYAGIDKLPWNRNKFTHVKKTIEELKDENVEKIGLSSHDSCDKSISIFKNKMREGYIEIKVGKEIKF